jgi:uncharacterized alkaline shock family protein YloU
MRPDTKVNLGVIQVHKSVIADICAVAIHEIEGITLAKNETVDGFLGLLGIKSNSAVDVVVDERNQVSVVIKVNIRYGLNLSDASRHIQDVVMTAVEKMADINLRDVDVSIRGIERG